MVTSLGTAGFPVVRALEGRCPLAGLALAQALYQAPSILWSAVAPEEAERLEQGLAAVGLDVEVQAADAEFEAGGPDVDVAIEVLDFSGMTDVLREVVLLLGADRRAARELLCRVPCLLVGGVSTATAVAIARRFDPAKVRVLPWSPAKALFDVYVTATTPDLRRRIVENLRATGHIADDHGPAQGLLMVEGLSFEAADTLWELAGKRPDTLRLVPQVLARFELVLGAAPVDEGGWQALAAFLDLPVGRLTAVANRLPVALRGGLDRDQTLAAMALLVPQGVPVHAELQATQAFGLTVSACPKPAESARLIEQPTDRPAAETEAGLRALPLRLAVAKKAPEVFFRHYLECTIESLERSGANEEVLRYCTKALEHHRGLKPVDAGQAQLIANDKATTLQRQGVTLLRMGRTEEAREALREATQLARAQGLSLPVADTLFGWVARGFRIEARRLEQELERHQYYGVRADTVHPERAIRLPASHLAGLAPGL